MNFNGVFLMILLAGCSSREVFNSKLLHERVGGENRGIIISCVRCECMIQALHDNNGVIDGISLFGDQLCLARNTFNIKTLSQKTLDTIFEKNYNIILFNFNTNNTFRYRLIKTEESLKFREILKDFFKN